VTKSDKFWRGMIIGVVLGAVSALLYAPKKGKELRDDVAEGMREAGKKAGAAWSEAKQRLDEVIGRTRKATQAGKHLAQDKQHEEEAQTENKEQ